MVFEQGSRLAGDVRCCARGGRKGGLVSPCDPEIPTSAHGPTERRRKDQGARLDCAAVAWTLVRRAADEKRNGVPAPDGARRQEGSEGCRRAQSDSALGARDVSLAPTGPPGARLSDLGESRFDGCNDVRSTSRPGTTAATACAMTRRAVIALLSLYRYLISPMLGPCCRFHPSCSEYSQQAIMTHGLGRGAYLTLRRLLRCHPWHPGGHDPVP